MDSSKVKTDLYERQEQTSIMIKDGPSHVEFVPLRGVDNQPLIDVVNKVKTQAEQYLEDAKSEEAKAQKKGEYKPRSFNIECHGKELRSNGWNYVLKVATISKLDDPYWVKAKYREMKQFRKKLEFRFPYVMPTLKHYFPPKKKQGTPTPILLALRVRQFDAWLKEICLKKALFESSEMQTLLIRDDSVQFASQEDYRSSENLKEARRQSLLSFDDPESKAGFISVSIVGTQEQRARGGNFMLYILEVRLNKEVWRIAHRYDEFFRLSNELSRAFPEKSTIKLPPATYTAKQTGRMSLSPVNKVDEQLIAERKQTLWTFIQDCVLQPVIRDCEQFQRFVMPVTSGLRDKITRRLSSVIDVHENSVGGEELRGELWKKGAKMTKAWRKRHFILDPVGQKISYYAGDINDEDKRELHGEIYLRAVTKAAAFTEEEAKMLKMKESLFGFSLDEPDRTWYLAAEQEDERQKWLSRVQAVQQASLGDLTRAGALKKQSSVLKQWNNRYMVCDPITQSVNLFKQRGSEITASLHLKDIIVCEELPPVLYPNVPNTFRVGTSTVTWNFSCSEKVEMEKWVTTIRGYMSGSFERHNSLVAPIEKRKLSRKLSDMRKLSGGKLARKFSSHTVTEAQTTQQADAHKAPSLTLVGAPVSQVLDSVEVPTTDETTNNGTKVTEDEEDHGEGEEKKKKEEKENEERKDEDKKDEDEVKDKDEEEVEEAEEVEESEEAEEIEEVEEAEEVEEVEEANTIQISDKSPPQQDGPTKAASLTKAEKSALKKAQKEKEKHDKLAAAKSAKDAKVLAAKKKKNDKAAAAAKKKEDKKRKK